MGGHRCQGQEARRDATTLEPTLGSGPYKVKELAPGRNIVYEKVADYWGKDLNVNVGANNFERVRYEYFRDGTVALEAFKGDQVDWRTENSAKNWATAYDFPAVRDKKVVQEEFPIRNRRRDAGFRLQYPARQVQGSARAARLQFAFDFEEMNQQLFYGQYKRIASYFEGTELASTACHKARNWKFSRP